MAEHYARAAARVTALQLADAAGFDVAQGSCAEVLADLLLRYIGELGAASHHYAELAGRTETNPVDVVRAAGGRPCFLCGNKGCCCLAAAGRRARRRPSNAHRRRPVSPAPRRTTLRRWR